MGAAMFRRFGRSWLSGLAGAYAQGVFSGAFAFVSVLSLFEDPPMRAVTSWLFVLSLGTMLLRRR